MKRRAIILLTLLAIFSIIDSRAQNATVTFAYDECGNRIERSLGFKKTEYNGRTIEGDQQTEWASQATDNFCDATLSLYPNPTEGHFTLTLSVMPTLPVALTLSTLEGAIIETRQMKSLSTAFDLSGKPAGIYLLHLSAGEKTQTWKIIKKN